MKVKHLVRGRCPSSAQTCSLGILLDALQLLSWWWIGSESVTPDAQEGPWLLAFTSIPCRANL
jgi:hypothetical protein